MIKKVIIPAAGRGTRLLPATKETPKEMLPIFFPGINGEISVKPLLQAIFEQFYDVGMREYCFIVGKGKGSIIDHFSSDRDYIRTLNEGGKGTIAKEFSHFYSMISDSSFVYVSQPEPKGFGDAVLRAEPYINETFLLQAGDTLILSKNNQHLKRLIHLHTKYDSVASIIIKKVQDPRSFGVIEGIELSKDVYEVTNIIEKPERPATNLAVTALYLFTPEIFLSLKKTKIGLGGEIQLTDGIHQLIKSGKKVIAIALTEDEYWLDVGNPLTYWEALSQSQKVFTQGNWDDSC